MNYRLSWFLRRHPDEWHSLADIAAALAMPVAAVGADLEDLAQHGFHLESHPITGVRLGEPPAAIDRDELALARAGRRIGSSVRVYDRTHSTNDVALTLAQGGSQCDGLVVLAEHQTAGRGRQGAAWFDSPGESVLMSVVHWSAGRRDAASEFMLAAGVAVAQAAQQVTGLPLTIKWPNDVEVRRRKVAGILVEVSHNRDGARSHGRPAPAGVPAVIGIGINANQPEGCFPREIVQRATSLRIASGRVVDRMLLLERVLDALEDCLDLLDKGCLEELLDRYMARCDMIGRDVTVKDGGAVFCGTVESISPHYALVLRLSEGGCRSFDAARVSLV